MRVGLGPVLSVSLIMRMPLNRFATVRTLATALLGSVAFATICHAQTVAAPPTITPSAQTTATARAKANTAVLVLDGAGGGKIVGSGALGGVEVYGLDGVRTGAFPAGDVAGLDVRYGVQVGGKSTTVVGVMDAQDSKLRFFAFDAASGEAHELTARALTASLAAESLCLFRSPLDGGLNAFALGRGGEIEQWSIFDDGSGKLDGRMVRRLHIPSEASFCTTDDRTGQLYVAEQAVGLWRFGADAEADPTPVLVDAARVGRIASETGGLATYDGGPGARYLIASNASASDFLVYDREADDKYLGSFALSGVQAAGGLFVTGAAGGLMIAANEDNPAGANYGLARFTDIASALRISVGSPQDPRQPTPSGLAIVRPVVETEPVQHAGDAADDPAIWVHPTDPSLSVIVTTDKKGGLAVYDLAGKRLQYVPDGKMNNVDLRDGFKLGGKSVTLVVASDRSHNAIAIYVLDPATRTLAAVSDGLQATTGLGDPYGLCMYRSRKGGKTYVFINDTDGKMRQWRLDATPGGKVRTTLVRAWAFGTQVEGCVADDATGALYVAEEDVAFWRMGAEPTASDAKVAIATVSDSPAMKDDLEGVGLYARPDGTGYLVLSSQGNNTYAVFKREGTNAYVGSFAVVANGASGIDGISETDGLDVSSRPMGPGFPDGAFVAQDGRNVSPPEMQNFKIVPWDVIARSLGLPR
jgi:3-phytase